MTEYDVKRLALVLSVQAEIEGMKIENANRANMDYSPAYNNESFKEKAEELKNLAYKQDFQL